jgi:hypothetical protein
MPDGSHRTSILFSHNLPHKNSQRKVNHSEDLEMLDRGLGVCVNARHDLTFVESLSYNLDISLRQIISRQIEDETGTGSTWFVITIYAV